LRPVSWLQKANLKLRTLSHFESLSVIS
jgi:hypothetical protein